MSGQQIGSTIGSVLGSAFGPIGSMIGSAIGGAVGGAIDDDDEAGPAEDLRVQASEYGRPIPIVYGTGPVGPSVIWASDLIKTGDGGGKGPEEGGTGPTYAINALFLVCESDGTHGLGRIWAGPEKRLVWDGMTLESGELRYYDGAAGQMPDPMYEAAMGVGNVPAYRGFATFALEGFDVSTHDGNRMPFFTVEIGNVNASCPAVAQVIDGVSVYDPPPEKIADISTGTYGRAFQDPTTGYVYYQYKDSGGTWLGRVDVDSGFDLGSPINLAPSTLATVNIAWDGAGYLQAVTGTNIYTIDLAAWDITLTSHIFGLYGSSVLQIGIWDVAWNEAETRWQYLAVENQVNFTTATPPAFAILGVNAAASNAGYPYDLTGGSVGSRFYGNLIPAGTHGAAGTNFPAQDAQYATDQLTWSAYDPTREMLVSFADGAYATLGVGGSYVNTSDFAVFGAGPTKTVYNAATDMFYVVTSAGIRMYDPNKLTPEHWPPEDCILFNTTSQGYANGEPVPIDFNLQILDLPAEPGYLGVISGGGDLLKVKIGGAVNPQGVALSEVVQDLHVRSGCPEALVNVTQLADDIVDGYALGNQVSVLDAIRALMPCYYFDAVESQGVIKYVKRGADIAVEIPDDDLGAYVSGGETPGLLDITRKQDDDLPRTLTVSYLLEATKYSTATKYARRLIGYSGDEAQMDTTMVFSNEKAAEIASVNLHDAWVGRITYVFQLPREYSYLEPTDPVGVQGHALRITKMTQSVEGYHKCEAVRDDSNTYDPDVIVEAAPPPPDSTVTVQSLTLLELM